jgi:TRAP-type C4-dicarboxylate transport system permease small subunit
VSGSGAAPGQGRAARTVERASAAIARVEAAGAAGLILATCCLILLNIATRSFGDALYWVDEAAIYCMVWSAFLGASLTIRGRNAVAIDLLRDALPPGAARALGRAVHTIVLLFGLALLALAWTWYDPLTLARAGFDIRAFSGETFNFIYREPTLTIGVAKWPIWLVMPLFGASVSLHALANLLDRADPWAPRFAAGALD